MGGGDQEVYQSLLYPCLILWPLRPCWGHLGICTHLLVCQRRWCSLDGLNSSNEILEDTRGQGEGRQFLLSLFGGLFSLHSQVTPSVCSHSAPEGTHLKRPRPHPLCFIFTCLLPEGPGSQCSHSVRQQWASTPVQGFMGARSTPSSRSPQGQHTQA